MFTIPELTANALGSYLAEHMHRRFGSTDAGRIQRVVWLPDLQSTVLGTVTRSITTSSIRCW